MAAWTGAARASVALFPLGQMFKKRPLDMSAIKEAKSAVPHLAKCPVGKTPLKEQALLTVNYVLVNVFGLKCRNHNCGCGSCRRIYDPSAVFVFGEEAFVHECFKTDDQFAVRFRVPSV